MNTGPGGTVSIGANGYVGPLPQIGTGIQPGFVSADMDETFPDVVSPTGADSWPVVPSNNIITNSGNYYMSNLTNSLTINAPKTTLFVAGSISLTGSSAITISTNATNVIIYVAGPSISVTSTATISNLTLRASTLSILGLPALTNINLGGNPAFTGTIFAPEADVSDLRQSRRLEL